MSLTVLDTSTSPGRAAAAMRAPIWTAIPRTPLRPLDLAGVDACAHLDAEVAQRQRRSPRRSGRRGRGRRTSRTSRRRRCRPRGRGSARAARARAGGAARAARSRRGRRARRLAVDPTMSVKSSVASTRSGSTSSRTPAEEPLDLVEQRLPIALPRQVVGARQLDHPRARDALAHEARRLAEVLARAVEHERRHADRRQHVPDVDLGVHQPDRPVRARARAAHARTTCTSGAPPGRAGSPGRRARATPSSPPPPSRPPRGAARRLSDIRRRSARSGSRAPASPRERAHQDERRRSAAGASRRRAPTSRRPPRCRARPRARSRPRPSPRGRRPSASPGRAGDPARRGRRGPCRACRRG